MKNEEWRMENGEWRMENGEWRMENGEWRIRLLIHHLPCNELHGYYILVQEIELRIIGITQ
jgi:hypothetical protein